MYEVKIGEDGKNIINLYHLLTCEMEIFSVTVLSSANSYLAEWLKEFDNAPEEWILKYSHNHKSYYCYE